jgi:CopA family copper-resistance protein
MARPSMQTGCGILGRRRFVLGVGSAGGVATLGIQGCATPTPVMAAEPATLSGQQFDLVLAPTPVNITGRPAVATAVNGQVPGPILHWQEGDTVTLNVTNRLSEATSIHWHGINPPAMMDGVPGVSFAGIAPGTTFTYRIPVRQSGTYWYHSHSGLQEPTGLYGPIIVAPRQPDPVRSDREHVVMLSDWSDGDPATILSNLKFDSDYYNHNQRTVGTFIADIRRSGLSATVADRLAWGGMRMSPTDLADVTGDLYTYLVNGRSPASNWTALFRPGERVRLRFINAASMTFFDVRIPGLKMTVVQADGDNVVPVEVDEFRMGPAETYDVLVIPSGRPAYTIFAQAQDRTGYARGTLAVQQGASAPVPPLDPRPIRTMVDMGMGGMEGMAGMGAASPKPAGAAMGGMTMADPRKPAAGDAMPGMAMADMDMGGAPPKPVAGGAMAGTAMSEKPLDTGPPLRTSPGRVEVDNLADNPIDRLGDPGIGLNNNGRRVLTYRDLRALKPNPDTRPPSREVVLHLTGNMDRYMWGFDGKKYSEAPEPIALKFGERVRFVLINDTMMEHPIHLHGMFSELDNGNGAYSPLKHTVIVKGGEKLSYLVTANAPGKWAYHCHLFYHLDAGMLRVVAVA